MHRIRKTTKNDTDKIFTLYKNTASILGGLARYEDEITKEYISTFIEKSIHNGLSLVIEIDDKIIGEIHSYKLGLKVFNHLLTDLTICIDPKFQGQKFAKKLFLEFIKIVKNDMLDIRRVELISRQSNTKAIDFYKNIGFEIEGCFKKRIDGLSKELEDDIPMAWIRNS